MRVPEWFLMLAALGVELLGAILKRPVPLTRYRVRSLRPLSPRDTSRATAILGWAPRIGVRRGLEITYPAVK